jgi:copper oxidase (laccase) domain-containing protein
MTTTTSTSRRSSSRPGLRVSATLTRHRVRVRCSTRRDGDFHRLDVPFDELDRRRGAFVGLPWTMLDEHHGTTIVRVDGPGAGDGALGDVAITSADDAVLGCWVGDCAPVVLVGAHREFAVVHAGWRGLAAGVIDAACAAFDEPVAEALIGPAIGPCCYEFGADDLIAVGRGVRAAPETITGRTRAGELALDVPGAVRAACRWNGIALTELASCTGCTYDGFSHRVRGDRERHVVAVWRQAEAAA